MSALLTPLTLVNDLCTETTQSLQVIPDTERVTVLISANALVANNRAAANSNLADRFIIRTLFAVVRGSECTTTARRLLQINSDTTGVPERLTLWQLQGVRY